MTVETRFDLDQALAEAIDFFSMSQEAIQPANAGRHRIGIMGGTFNPPHIAHLLMAEQVGSQLDLDEVWFMPTATPPHAQGKTTIASQHRVQMVQKAIAGNSRFKLQPYEVNKGGTNYTYDTMAHFTKAYPETDFYYIIGTDSANDLATWHRIDDLVRLVQFVGVRRPGEKPYNGPYPILWVDSPLMDISSTEIRLRVFLEQSIRYQVPQAVAEYIDKHGLYKEG